MGLSATLRTNLFSTVVSLYGISACAQGTIGRVCDLDLETLKTTRTETMMAIAERFECLLSNFNSMKSQIDRLPVLEREITHLKQINARLEAQLDKLDEAVPQGAAFVLTLGLLDQSIKDIKRENREFSEKMGPLAKPNSAGMIAAFDRDQKQETLCPDGWEYFEPAGGRTIVGAGDHDNKWFPDGSDTSVKISTYSTYAQDKWSGVQETREAKSTGGEEQVLLHSENIAAHSHEVVTKLGDPFSFRTYKYANGTSGVQIMDRTGDESIQSFIAQENQLKANVVPHNNMPPFIALYYCKKL